MSLKDKVLGVFDTVEGWAVVLSLAWLALAKALGWPVSFDTGAGVISPAGMLLIAGPPVLAKLGWSMPFQPIPAAGAQGIAKGVATFVLPLALTASLLMGGAPAQAQVVEVPAGSLQRLSVGLKADAVEYQWDSVDIPNSIGFMPGVVATWSLTSGMTLAGNVGHDFNTGLTQSRLGARALALTIDDHVQMGVLVDRVWYSGSPASNYLVQDSWQVGLQTAWSVWEAKGSGRTIMYATLAVTDDINNGAWQVVAGTTIALVGGKP